MNLRGTLEGKELYGKLKSFLHRNYRPLENIKTITNTLLKAGRRPLIFTRTKKEKETFLETKWHKSVTMYTVQEAAFGLNLQHDCDAIITRPQPGDIMEQMKGRIDRPGQRP
eukprot:UN13509